MPNKKFIIGFLLLIIFGAVLIKTIKVFPIALGLLFNREVELKKSDGNINILLLGVAGGNHEGPDLTDTVIFASIDPGKNKATLISIPRDLWIPDISEKINTAYAIGNGKKAGGGLILAKAVVSKVLDQPIDYVVVLDFDGFIKAVDLIGGLDIDIEREFDDYEYPIEEKRDDLCGHTLEEATQRIATQSALEVFPCRYQYVHFDNGLQHLDGARSLIFSRSRFAKGEEGTDFARSKRQQKIISAFKDKVFSLGTVLNPIKVANLYSLVSEHIQTNIQEKEFDDFIKLAEKMKNTTIDSFVINPEDKERNGKGFLVNPPLEDFEGKWVLIPKIGNGNYLEIQGFVRCVLTSSSCKVL